MSKKFVCPNCGARLLEEDKECYVCGMTIEEMLKFNNDNQTESLYDEEDTPSPQQEDYDEVSHEEEYDYDNEDSRENYHKQGMSKAKKAGIICGVSVGVIALIAVLVCLFFYKGIFTTQTEPEEYTIYFDKPLSDINLIDSQGTVYNWGGDVEVIYTLDNKRQESTCKVSVEYDNLWECKIPATATNVYFSPSTTDNIRTEAISQPEDEYVYYITDTLLNENLHMAISSCPLIEFGNQGINYVIPTEEEAIASSTQAPTQAPTEAPTEAVTVPETTTEAVSATETTAVTELYSISVPSSWSSGTTVIKKGNCTTYYETYNYKNYQMGSLISIYVVDKSDTSYSNMNNVKMVKKTSDGKKKIVVVTPTDIQFNDADETATNNYIALSNLTNQVISSITAN